MENNSIVKFSPDQQQINTIRETICATATEPEFGMFLEVCKGTGLNPFLNEIWFIKIEWMKWDEALKKKVPASKTNIFAGRDGYLKIANNHPQYDGMECPVTYDETTKAPISATATVYRKDRSHPATFTARFSEYYKADSKFWKDNPSAAIQKVAEAGALKRAFAISGLLTLEEFGVNNIQDAAKRMKGEDETTASETERATVKECEEVTKRMKWADITVILDKYKVSSLRELPREAVLDMIKGLTPEPANVVEADYEVVNEPEAAKPHTEPGVGNEARPKAKNKKAIKPAAAVSPGKENGGFNTPENTDNVVSPPAAQAAQPAAAPKKEAKPPKDDGSHYTCEPNRVLDKWNVYKYDSGNHILATYHVERDLSGCDCPSRKKPCKHQQFVSAYKQSAEYNEKYGSQRAYDKMHDKKHYDEIRKVKGYEIAVSEFLKDKFAMGLAVVFDYMTKKMNCGTTAGLKPAHWQLVFDIMFDLSQDEIDKILGFKKEGKI
jgi:phage recombination protein Bet